MATIEQFKTVILELAAVLRAIEWSKTQSETGWASSGFCIVCDSPKFRGHKPTCPLGVSMQHASFVMKEEAVIV